MKPARVTSWSLGNYRWLVLVIIVFLYLLSHLGFSLPFNVAASLFHPSFAFEVGSVVLVFLGLVCAVVARHTLSRYWSPNIDIKKKHKIVTWGIYSYIRHPIYFAFLIMAIGTLLNDFAIATITLFFISFIFLLFKARNEEKLLLKYFPEEYKEYRKRTKAIIPYIF